LSVVVIGCLPRPQAVTPEPGGRPAPELALDTAHDRALDTARAAPSADAAVLLGQAPMGPAPAPQPYPQPARPAQQAPYPQPAQAPYPQPAQPPYPQPAPQPYPQPAQQPSGYPPLQMYPQVQPYAAPRPYPPPTGLDASIRRSGSSPEIIMDFAAVGTLASIDLLVRQDITNGSAGTFIVAAGMAGGGALGWLLSEKYDRAPGAAHATTLGLMVGSANAALLIQPTNWTDADQVLGLLLLGSAIGTGAGFAYGQSTDLTSGQSTFVGNVALLGSATAAFTAITGSRDGKFGGWEDGVLALGLDAGVLGGALIAPQLNWSPRRSRTVLASTAVGAFLGGLLVGLATKRGDGDSSNGDLVAGCMTAGMWGGFGLGIFMTSDAEPDIRFQKAVPGPAVTVAPFAGEHGQVGVMAGGSW
jgi:hypothetical protein